MKFTGGLDFGSAAAAITRGAMRGAERVADDVFDESQELVPDDPETGGSGDLQASGQVTRAHTATTAGAAISYGTDHAVYQHERLDYDHPDGGSAKFLERPLSAAQKTAGATVAAEIRKALS